MDPHEENGASIRYGLAYRLSSNHRVGRTGEMSPIGSMFRGVLLPKTVRNGLASPAGGYDVGDDRRGWVVR